MLTQVDVVYENESGPQALALPILGVTPKESLLIRKITGLNPPDVNVFIGDYARDGGFYQGRRVGKRNVVMTLDLNPNPALGQTVDGLRKLLYRIFMSPRLNADHTQFILHDDDAPTRYIVGYAEKFEGELFDVETMAQVSIICPDPYIRDLSETIFLDSAGWVTVPFNYEGNAESGFYAEVHIVTPTPVLTLANNGRTMQLYYSFNVGDIVTFDTNGGSRMIRLQRGGTQTSMLPYLTPTSSWLSLHGQGNTVTVYGSNTTFRPGVIKRLNYRASYWGA